jgi:predicted secreted protein
LLKAEDSPAGSATYHTITNVTSISGPTLSRDTIDVTSHSSTGGYREFINGLKDGGEVSFDLLYDPDDVTHNTNTTTPNMGLLALYDSGATWEFTITFTDDTSTVWTFDAVVTSFEITAGIDDALKASVTLKVSGAPTLA